MALALTSTTVIIPPLHLLFRLVMGLSADREIAESQADEEDHLNDHYKHPAESFRTQPTVLIPGGTRLTVRSSERYVSTTILYVFAL